MAENCITVNELATVTPECCSQLGDSLGTWARLTTEKGRVRCRSCLPTDYTFRASFMNSEYCRSEAAGVSFGVRLVRLPSLPLVDPPSHQGQLYT